MESGALSCCCCTSALNQLGNSLAQLRAFFLPVSDALKLQTQGFLTFWSNRIVKTNALDKTAIAAIARVSNYDVEEGAILGAAA